MSFLFICIALFGIPNFSQAQHSFWDKANLFQEQKKNAIKFNIPSIVLLEHLDVSYEKAISSRQSLELKLGIIGIGFLRHETITIYKEGVERKIPAIDKGIFLAGGYKFFLFPLKTTMLRRNPHILKGFYLQPELIFGTYQKREYDTPYNYLKKKVNYHAMLLNLGVQILIKNKIVIDIFQGVGYGNDNLEKNSSDDPYYLGEFHRGLYKVKAGPSFAARVGIKVGFVF